ncbi:RNA 2',3'-cyclic 3'-phosphodiesterase [Lentibacillus sp. JNUCC-1]|uniref:YjcG family protein n=1 Tax=Lentibacillus sp. JNUCC-1 TaxID=2654513 RepID=UPI0012E9718C|nr:YjcG family protein [Lentibacillus sp. JNUCC-1]MUV36497.1 RNA 2',3'-cyclic 3'-phosphodiesterase [Lentibacillus sp. JNUCC-1]
MTNYGIAIFPSKRIQDDANALRKRYDPHYENIPPHITLKEKFETDDKTIDQLIPELDKIAEETKPFTLNINKVSTFAPVTNTIYMKVEPIQELQELHQKMHEGIFPQNATYQFIPHITVAQKLVEDEYSDVFGSLRMKEMAYEDYIDRFHLLYQLENGTWTVYETFQFGKKA